MTTFYHKLAGVSGGPIQAQDERERPVLPFGADGQGDLSLTVFRGPYGAAVVMGEPVGNSERLGPFPYRRGCYEAKAKGRESNIFLM